MKSEEGKKTKEGGFPAHSMPQPVVKEDLITEPAPAPSPLDEEEGE
jgi:hypothetical protein